MAVETVTVEEIHRRFKAQGVGAREHVAVKCPMCGTVQSMASLAKAGAAADAAERAIGFSCEGRFNGAGPWPNGKAAQAKRRKRGCDWTLGGLFKIHKLEVATPEGPRAYFEIAAPDEARDLEARMKAA